MLACAQNVKANISLLRNFYKFVLYFLFISGLPLDWIAFGCPESFGSVVLLSQLLFLNIRIYDYYSVPKPSNLPILTKMYSVMYVYGKLAMATMTPMTSFYKKQPIQSDI